MAPVPRRDFIYSVLAGGFPITAMNAASASPHQSRETYDGLTNTVVEYRAGRGLASARNDSGDGRALERQGSQRRSVVVALSAQCGNKSATNGVKNGLPEGVRKAAIVACSTTVAAPVKQSIRLRQGAGPDLSPETVCGAQPDQARQVVRHRTVPLFRESGIRPRHS